jgi:hypothetical protein
MLSGRNITIVDGMDGLEETSGTFPKSRPIVIKIEKPLKHSHPDRIGKIETLF